MPVKGKELFLCSNLCREVNTLSCPMCSCCRSNLLMVVEGHHQVIDVDMEEEEEEVEVEVEVVVGAVLASHVILNFEVCPLV